MIHKDVRAMNSNFSSINSSHDIIQIWPVGKHEVIPQKIDIVFLYGGDGTLLRLLRQLYLHYDEVEIPQIAAFNHVSSRLL